jgi:hypothetical protein
MSAHAIASKFRRALRNGTGANFTNDELGELGRMGVLVMLAEIEARELCGEPAGPPAEVRPARDPSNTPSRGADDGFAYIAALTADMPSGKR